MLVSSDAKTPRGIFEHGAFCQGLELGCMWFVVRVILGIAYIRGIACPSHSFCDTVRLLEKKKREIKGFAQVLI